MTDRLLGISKKASQPRFPQGCFLKDDDGCGSYVEELTTVFEICRGEIFNSHQGLSEKISSMTCIFILTFSTENVLKDLLLKALTPKVYDF